MKKSVDYRKFYPFRGKSFELLVPVMFILSFILVIFTGVMSYVRLNRIIGTVNSAISPDLKLEQVKDVYKDLVEAENRMKSYNLSGKERDFTRYSETTGLISGKMHELKDQLKAGEEMIPTIDTLDILVDEKINILDMLIILKDDYRLQYAMDEVLKKISIEEPPPDTARQLTDTLIQKGISKEEILFSLLYRRSIGEGSIKEDHIDETFKADERSNPVKELGKEVERIKRKALSEDHFLQQQELEFLKQDRIIMEHILDIIARWESRVEQQSISKTKTAENEASEIRRIIVSFGLATLLFLVLGAMMALIYFRRNKEYSHILITARKDAEELAQAKERFLASMSHEIKTPMNVISGYLAQILKNPLGNEQRENIEIVKKSSDHLLLLLNNLLDLSKLQAQKLELVETEFIPADLIREMDLWFSPAASKKNIPLIIECHPGLPSRLTGDPVRTRQILANLIDNAIKYTDSGAVTLRVFPAGDSDGQETLVFEVTDTGIGIPKDDLADIFQEFSQGKVVPGKKTEGTGLGLAITSKLVEKMGGTLHVISTPGKGSVFTAAIPFKPVIAIANAQDAENLTELDLLEDLLILVADDEAFNRSLLKLMLEKYHCRIVEAADGKEAIAVATENNPDLVLMDIRMPGISGPEAAEKIRANLMKRGNDIPIIALSAGVTLEEMNIYRSSGMRAFISKPFEEAELINAIIRLIKIERIPISTASGETDPENSGKETSLHPAGRGYDLGPLRNSCANDPAFFREMLALFFQNTENGLKQMEEFYKDGSLKSIPDLAHRISAPCRQIRAEMLYSLVKNAERQAEQKKPQELEITLGQIRLEFERIQADILDQPEFKTDKHE